MTEPIAVDKAELAQTRREGRAVIVAMHSATRVMKLYPAEHQAVQKALAELVTAADEIREADKELDLRVQGEFIFVNGTRLRLDLSNYASFGTVLSLLRASGIGGLKVVEKSTTRDWLVFLSLLSDPAAIGAPGANAMGKPQTPAVEPEDRLPDIVGRLAQSGIMVFELEPPAEGEGADVQAEGASAAAKRTYVQSVALTKDVINSVRMGRTPSFRKIKRVVQGIVDQVLNEEMSLIGLTTLREYDEYTYTHSVNVCIFSVALGRRLGMTKLQLYELGIAALMHDIGKSRVPTDVLQKTNGLDDSDWRRIAAHPWLGVLALFQLKGHQDLPYRAMVVAHEHHMKCDLSGYPRPLRPRALTMMSKIVAVADGYDAATSRRAYQTTPYPPSAALQEMRDNPRRGMDNAVVKAFINLLGIYPAGTLVVLDTFELAVVHSANPNPDLLSRPIVVIVSDATGNLLHPPQRVDLAAQGPDGQFARTIIKTADPDRYGIRVSDYLI